MRTTLDIADDVLQAAEERARRADEGLPDWKAAGLPVERTA